MPFLRLPDWLMPKAWLVVAKRKKAARLPGYYARTIGNSTLIGRKTAPFGSWGKENLGRSLPPHVPRVNKA